MFFKRWRFMSRNRYITALIITLILSFSTITVMMEVDIFVDSNLKYDEVDSRLQELVIFMLNFDELAGPEVMLYHMLELQELFDSIEKSKKLRLEDRGNLEFIAGTIDEALLGLTLEKGVDAERVDEAWARIYRVFSDDLNVSYLRGGLLGWYEGAVIKDRVLKLAVIFFTLLFSITAIALFTVRYAKGRVKS